MRLQEPARDYTNQWKADAVVHRPGLNEGEPIRVGLETHLGYESGYSFDIWIEERCNMAVAHIQPDLYLTEKPTEHWVLWDLKTSQPVETLDKVQVLDVLRRGAPDVFFTDHQWGFFQDAPGRRTRHVVGRHNVDPVFLHLNTRNCSLQPFTLQIASDTEDMGRFVTLPVMEPAPAGSQ